MRVTTHPFSNMPDKEAFNNLKNLCKYVLEPLREAAGIPIKVNSGYRCPEVNTLVGGVKNSQHLKGQAADITCGSKNCNLLLAALAQAMRLRFDQLIIENGGQWLHISFTDIMTARRQVIHKNVTKK